ncbi:MAG: alpha/beta fold hydrolase [Pseudomonadota bacterium]
MIGRITTRRVRAALTGRGPLGAGLLLLAGVAAAAETATPATVLELEDCRISAGPGFPGIKARCGKFERPLNPNKTNPHEPGGSVISLNVAVVPALNLEPEPDPVVPLAGGPGQGAIHFYTAYAQAFEPLRRNRDILLVDQRGTGESAALRCEFEDDVLEGTLSDEETIALTRECIAALPHDPRFFTTSVAVADLDAVRAALGYPALNLYGISYGSRVAQHYARRYPATTRSIIVDGVVPPDLPLGPDIALESQAAVERILARCEEDALCAEQFPEVSNAFATVRERLNAEAVNVRLADPVTGAVDSISFGAAEFAAAIRLLAYHPNTIALIPLLVNEAVEGNYQPLAAQFVMTTKSLADSLAIGMHNAVMCSEDVPRYAEQSIDQAALEATYMGPLLIDTMRNVCSVWPVGLVDEDFGTLLSTDIPTLLLSGSADPITPPAYATRAAAGLKRAWLLSGKHQGHGQFSIGCMPDVLAGFVAERELADGAADCFNDSFVMPFFLSFAGPAP